MRNVEGAKITFRSKLPEGGTERQSGMVYLPAQQEGEKSELTWLIYLKGTELRSEYTPSRGKHEELPFIFAAAALGYAVWVPDYAGMGDGEGVQEYCVAESLADSALDGLAAARAWLAASKVAGSSYQESGRFAVIGYSEGGLAAMATIAALVERRIEAPGLTLTAAYSMGAPLNLNIYIPHLSPDPFVIKHPEYQIALALGLKRAYPNEFKLEDIFLTRTMEKIVPLFDGQSGDDKLLAEVANIAGKKNVVTDADIFTPAYCAALRSAPESLAYYRLLERNRLDRWTPPSDIHIVLAASPTDEIVPFENSLSEYEWAKQQAPNADIELVRLSNKTHIKAGIEALLYAILDFDRLEAIERTSSSTSSMSMFDSHH